MIDAIGALSDKLIQPHITIYFAIQTSFLDEEATFANPGSEQPVYEGELVGKVVNLLPPSQGANINAKLFSDLCVRQLVVKQHFNRL